MLCVAEKARGAGMPDLSDAGFEMLQVAVRLARDQQIKTVAALRGRMCSMFGSERAGDIDQALTYWAARIATVGVID